MADTSEQLLRARARALARPVEAGPGTQEEIIVLRAGDVRVGVPLERVRSVSPPDRTARIPGGDHAVLGMRAIGGDLVAVADVGALLGSASDRRAGDRYALLVDHRDGPLGVLADTVEGITALDVGKLRAVPGEDAAVRGVSIDGVLVVDVDRLFADSQLTTAEPEPEPPRPRPDGGAT